MEINDQRNNDISPGGLIYQINTLMKCSSVSLNLSKWTKHQVQQELTGKSQNKKRQNPIRKAGNGLAS